MKKPRPTLLLTGIVLVALLLPCSALAGLSDIIKGLGRSLGAGGLSEEKISAGLKEALAIGAENAVQRVSQVNGYYKNPDIRIPLPRSFEKVEQVARIAGYGDSMESFMESMNRAAENAAPQAASLFADAVRGMTLQDARNILNGPEDAATSYLREKTYSKLVGAFTPKVHESMAQVAVTRRYQELTSRLESLPLAGSLGSLDLDRYVTEKSLDGLFYMIAREEARIRHDPAARVTDLLKDVFGGAGN